MATKTETLTRAQLDTIVALHEKAIVRARAQRLLDAYNRHFHRPVLLSLEYIDRRHFALVECTSTRKVLFDTRAGD